MRRRDLLRALGLSPALIACARRMPDADVATWLAVALHGDPPDGEVEALRALIAERDLPAAGVEHWDRAAWIEVREILRRHVAGSHAFRTWAGLGPAKARACGGLVPA